MSCLYTRSPFTTKQSEVAILLEGGLIDRQVGDALPHQLNGRVASEKWEHLIQELAKISKPARWKSAVALVGLIPLMAGLVLVCLIGPQSGPILLSLGGLLLSAWSSYSRWQSRNEHINSMKELVSGILGVSLAIDGVALSLQRTDTCCGLACTAQFGVMLQPASERTSSGQPSPRGTNNTPRNEQSGFVPKVYVDEGHALEVSAPGLEIVHRSGNAQVVADQVSHPESILAVDEVSVTSGDTRGPLTLQRDIEGKAADAFLFRLFSPTKPPEHRSPEIQV